MFYCSPCATKNEWPESFSRSYGLCEMCDSMAACFDVPSAFLPIKVPVIPGPEIYQGKHRKENKDG